MTCRTRRIARQQVALPTLRAMVTDYRRRHSAVAEQELAFFANQPSLSATLRQAAKAIDHRGKRYSHQCRISAAPMDLAHQRMTALSGRLLGCADFKALHGLLEAAPKPISGLGPLYIYDTAFRIGAYLKRLPTEVYLHAGTRAGARALGHSGATLSPSALPAQLRALAPHEIENFLCIYAKDLQRLRAGTPPIPRLRFARLSSNALRW